MSKPQYIPILFKPEMVNAILEGRKTQTRREVKPGDALDYLDSHEELPYYFQNAAIIGPYQPGNVLWVREQYCETSPEYLDKTSGLPFGYKANAKGPNADEVMKEFGWKWKPSIHMPKEACRLFLEVTEVRVQRLQDITETDAANEGVEIIPCTLLGGGDTIRYRDYRFKDKHADKARLFNTAIASFTTLWESINGKGSMGKNPFVWAITFKRIDKPANWPNN